MSRREWWNLALLIGLLLIGAWSVYQAAMLHDTPQLRKVRDQTCPRWIC